MFRCERYHFISRLRAMGVSLLSCDKRASAASEIIPNKYRQVADFLSLDTHSFGFTFSNKTRTPTESGRGDLFLILFFAHPRDCRFQNQTADAPSSQVERTGSRGPTLDSLSFPVNVKREREREKKSENGAAGMTCSTEGKREHGGNQKVPRHT